MDHLELTKSEEQLVRRLGMAVRAEIWPASTDVREALTSFLEKPAKQELPLEEFALGSERK
jgi:hypothetical protein